MVKSSEYQPIEDAYFQLMGDAETILEDIMKHTLRARKAMEEPVNADVLANEQVELAILNQRLGDRVSEAGMISRSAENHYKTVREEHKLRLVQVGEEMEFEIPPAKGSRAKPKIETRMVKMAAGTADSAKMKLSQDEFDLYNGAEELNSRLQNMRRANDKTIDAIRSKLSFEKSDYKNS